jgi:hypothetical protein
VKAFILEHNTPTKPQAAAKAPARKASAKAR